MANGIMNANNTIKSLIPQQVIENIPQEKRARAAHNHHLEMAKLHGGNNA